ncbi:hypothetical protein GCM10027429_30100 [Marivirga atlantica]|jgi:opacity protein-like surface antigen|uniref:Outer membrane protein beta-barrel domain-containing protein n=1 Tax=Marivirga atlantica TaxID=1548457 RepID=A0A937AD26_9BACT|nr:hypothetical protein [Marivirga atlantica]MBL0766590.1 hypothetical protein [Marivirga atlantica]
MRTKLFILFISVFVVKYAVKAQNKLYIGLEASIVQDQYTLSNPESSIEPPYPHFVEPATTFNIGYQLNSLISIETGFTYKPFSTGYIIRIDENNTSGTNLSILSRFQIPLRINSKIALLKDKLFLNTTLGYHIGFNPNSYKALEFIGSTGDGYTIEKRYNKSYGLLETAIGLEFNLTNKWSIYNTIGLMHGLKELERTRISEYQDFQRMQSNTIIDKGGYLNIGFGFRYKLK